MSLKNLGRVEFIALQAMLMAITAFAIDAMLPALPDIAQQLSPGNPNRAQLIVTSFVLGMGIGTLFAGPISDAYGRKPVIIAGFAVFCVGAALASVAQSLEMLLAARVLQGLGVAAPRIVPVALIRDLYSGREMASIISFATMIFMLMPAVAPAFGTVIIQGFGWRGLFASFIVFAVFSALWLGLRQPETLPPANRRPLRPKLLWQGLREVLSHHTVVMCIAVMTMGFGVLFGTLSSTQQIFDITFRRGESFALWFGLIALLSLPAGFLNARLVGRLGMRRLVTLTFLAQLGITVIVLVLIRSAILPDQYAFAAYVVWAVSVFSMANIVFGNLNAIALAQLGHIAGLASSVVIAAATVLAVAVAAPLGLIFDGTPVPLLVGVAVLLALAIGLMQMMPKDVRVISPSA
ncbi:MAG: multidrug effflux MFS transporter [Rhodoferax sp.]|nr:multidrug effflux MFS transporter [Pseudorhodobacter sp.]